MKIPQSVINKVLEYRHKKRQKGMILTHDKKTGKLIGFKFVYE